MYNSVYAETLIIHTGTKDKRDMGTKDLPSMSRPL